MGNRKFKEYSLDELVKRKGLIEKNLSSFLNALLEFVNNAWEPIIEGRNDGGYSKINNDYTKQINFAFELNDYLPDNSKIDLSSYINKYAKVIDRIDEINKDYIFREKEKIRSNLSESELKKRSGTNEEEFEIMVLKDPKV